MEINPPISSRTTQELLEIIEAPEEWQPDVVVLAQNELKQRGVSRDTQELRRKSLSKFRSKIESIKSRASYTKVEKLLIVLFGPILVLIFFDLFLFYSGEGYKRKNRQGLLFLLLGIAIWIIVFTIIFN